MTLVDLVVRTSKRLKDAGVAFGHGTTNAFDEAAWLVTWALGLPLDALETAGGRALAGADETKVEALLARRIETTLSTTGGTSDGRFLAKICAEVVELGPVNASIHKIDEHVAIADLDVLKDVYRATLEQLVA